MRSEAVERGRGASLESVDWRGLAKGPALRARVELIVCRLPGEARKLPDAARLSGEEGLEGDRWGPADGAERQVTLINHAVARVLARDDARLPELGDNLLVDLDLSEENLPPGTRLRLGEAEVEVTAEPHLGCAKFARRFGHEALRLVNSRELRPLKLRGINARVVRSGEVRVGSPVVKLESERPQTGG